MAKDATEAAIELDPAKAADPTLIDRADQNSMKQCQLTVNESVQGMLLRSLREDAGSGSGGAGSDLVANNEINIRAAAGSDCRLVLAAQSGPFDQLPCHAHYDLEGDLAK
jgi:hypothetical protein